MSVRQAWRQTTIGNKVGAICGVLALFVSSGSAVLNYCQVKAAQDQYQLGAKANHEQRLLEWDRLVFEDNSAMPDITAVTIPFKAVNDHGGVVVQLSNVGTGATSEVFIDDAATGRDVIPPVMTLPPGGQQNVTLPANRLDRTRLMRLVCKTPHGSIRTKTFYFVADYQSQTVSDLIDHPFDFLIADEPGRKNYVPAAQFGFGPPVSSK